MDLIIDCKPHLHRNLERTHLFREQYITKDPFPHIKPAADEFHIYIKKERLSFQKNQLLVDYLTRLKPSEFGMD